MSEHLSHSAQAGLRQLFVEEQSTRVGRRCSPSPSSTAGPPTGGPIYFPPDALNVSGRRTQRQLRQAPMSFLSLLHVVGDRRQHTLYYAEIDQTVGQCYDPELLRGVAQVMREALRINARAGHPAWLTVEVGRGAHPLHLHVMSRDDATLPDSITIKGHNGNAIAHFVRKKGRSVMSNAHELAVYLRKCGHVGAGAFNKCLPADDPEQPPVFQQAYQAWLAGHARRVALNLQKLPRRSFGLFIPRLTDQQRKEALKILEDLEAGEQPVNTISPTEWRQPEIQNLLPIKRCTPQATERLRQSVVVLIRAAQNGRNIFAAWKSQRQKIPKSTVYNLFKKLGWSLIDSLVKVIRKLRKGLQESRLYRALKKLKR